jgi:hypothetical protein
VNSRAPVVATAAPTDTSRISAASRAVAAARGPPPSAIGRQLSGRRQRPAARADGLAPRSPRGTALAMRRDAAGNQRRRIESKNERTTVMKTSAIITSLALSGLFAAAPALAQEDASTGEGTNAATPIATPTVSSSRSLATMPVVPTGFAFQLGGGVTGFSRQATRNTFGTGGYWDARAILGSRSFLGAELAYIGSARDATASGLTGSAALLGDGAEAAVRVNLPIEATQHLLVEPFVFGGVGWTYYQIVNEDSNSSSVKDHANALSIPFGAGVSAAYNHFTVDARFTYRSVFDDKLVPLTGADRDHEDLQNWSAGLTVGYEL